MQISDGGMAMNMSAQHHMEHFDNVLNLNMNNEYQYAMEYWNGSYKNGSTPMKEMEGEFERVSSAIVHVFLLESKECKASSHLSITSLTPSDYLRFVQFLIPTSCVEKDKTSIFVKEQARASCSINLKLNSRTFL